MSGKCDTIIQNNAAIICDKTSEIASTEVDNRRADGIEQLHKTVKFLYGKFKRQELSEEDFQRALSFHDENQNISMNDKRKSVHPREPNLDEIVPVDFELDFRDGKIELNKTSKDRVCVNCSRKMQNEKQIKSSENALDMKLQMKQLMKTFEHEKKKLLQNVENEKQVISKEISDKYEKQLRIEKDFLGTVIADLVKSLEDAREELDEVKKLRENDRLCLQKYYKKKLAEERKKLQFQFKHE